MIGVFGSQNALILDYALREQGSYNPNVVRAAPTATQVAQFAGTGIARRLAHCSMSTTSMSI